MAIAYNGDPEQIIKLREIAAKLGGMKELYFTDNPLKVIDDIKVRYQLRTIEDIKLLPRNLQAKLFIQSGRLREQYRNILEWLLSAGKKIPEGLDLENYALHLVRIGLIGREKSPHDPKIWVYKILKPEIAEALIGDYSLPLHER